MHSFWTQHWHRFTLNKRACWSLWVFLTLFGLSLFAEWIANDRPILVMYNQSIHFPVLVDYLETDFGGDFDSFVDYHDPYIQQLINENGWMLWPLVPYRFDTVIHDLTGSVPSAPSHQNLLGTDDRARDVLAILIYGFRTSVLFGLLLTLASSVIGVFIGAIQGYFGGLVDLCAQRGLEIWSGLPSLYVLIILSSLIEPNFIWLFFILLLFSWTSLVGIVRAEFLRVRNFEYVKSAQAMGLSSARIMFRHILPNAMVATLTFLPFILNASITSLMALDFLGYGLPSDEYASLGELLAQGKTNLYAPWLGVTSFVALALMLGLLIFIGEGIRDAFDPRRIGTFAS